VSAPTEKPTRYPWWPGPDEPESAWDLYGAWDGWMQKVWQDRIPDDESTPFDDMDTSAKSLLYSIMWRLADGEAIPT
jgi:hypothetical protein